jgi:cytochrome c biogenesis protein CcmG, thiol:disulfide interchange protein DsbE
MATVLVATVLAVAGCGGGSSNAGNSGLGQKAASVRVDTPALRRQKAAAHIEPCPPSRGHVEPKAGGLPAITLPCLGGGRSVDLAGLSGTPTVINFWSQTCGPCRSESPILQRVHRATKDRLRVLGVDWQDPRPSYAIAFARQLGLTYPQLADPDGATRGPLRIVGLPITVFVSASGRVVHTEYGAVSSRQQLLRLADHYLHVPLVRSRP